MRERGREVRGARGRRPERRGRRAASRRWLGACRRAVATRLASFWREVGDGGGSVGWVTGIGPGGLRGERQVVLLLFPLLIVFYIFLPLF